MLSHALSCDVLTMWAQGGHRMVGVQGVIRYRSVFVLPFESMSQKIHLIGLAASVDGVSL